VHTIAAHGRFHFIGARGFLRTMQKWTPLTAVDSKRDLNEIKNWACLR